MAVIRDCVGCGFCCRKAPCIASLRLTGGSRECPFLLWDGKRYWCELCQMSGESGQRYREQLVIGAGCCCPMNTDRRDIPAPMQFSA